MITSAWMHMKGLGPVRIEMLKQMGILTWQDVLDRPSKLPESLRFDLITECHRCLEALQQNDIRFFASRFDPGDRFRLLHQFGHAASYFDIETTGLEYDDSITVITCWHNRKVHAFVEGENLDDFLDLLDEVELLVSFNGSTFDVPRILDTFHIPELPCAHVDLRWSCHHRGLKGGLKQITSSLGLTRPADLQNADGQLAVDLWQLWMNHGDEDAKQSLIRYCASDVLLLEPLAQHLADLPMSKVEDLCEHLPKATSPQMVTTRVDVRLDALTTMFGPASPSKLRTRRRRTG